jgi:hypothetical protein
MQNEPVQAVWGAANIARVIGAPVRKTFYLLEKGLVPGRKVGSTWQSTRQELHDFLLGREVAGQRVGNATSDAAE